MHLGALSRGILGGWDLKGWGCGVSIHGLGKWSAHPSSSLLVFTLTISILLAGGLNVVVENLTLNIESQTLNLQEVGHHCCRNARLP